MNADAPSSPPPPTAASEVTAGGTLSADDMVKIRSLYMQSKICVWLSAAFGICGFIMFAYLYQKYIAPNPVDALRNISTLFMVLFPFLPAIALSIAAKRYEKRYLAMMPKG